jgi:hypothetical protein
MELIERIDALFSSHDTGSKQLGRILCHKYRIDYWVGVARAPHYKKYQVLYLGLRKPDMKQTERVCEGGTIHHRMVEVVGDDMHDGEVKRRLIKLSRDDKRTDIQDAAKQRSGDEGIRQVIAS